MHRAEYIPGVCNIGRLEMRRRLFVGWVGAFLTIACFVLFFTVDMPREWRLAVLFPASFAAAGFLQYGMHFCAAFGLLGVFNLSAREGKTDTVLESSFRRKDRVKALIILSLISLISVAVAAAAYLLPV